MKTYSNNYLANLYPNQYYHIYNRTNNGESLFKSKKDRHYFLYKYKNFLAPYLNTFAYCLLDNHFHFLVQIKKESDILHTIRKSPISQLTNSQKLSLKQDINDIDFKQIISQQFNRFFTSYAMTFNKQNKRKGNLFNRPFKRVAIENDNHFTYLIYYIHANPVLHKIQHSFIDYQWSSYKSLLSNRLTLLERQIVLNWFGGSANFKAFHQEQHKLNIIEELVID